MKTVLSLSIALVAGIALAQSAPPQRTDAQRQAAIDAAIKAMAKAKAEATLHIGDPAPPVKVEWVKGHGSTDFHDGKVHVVECWATWCGPCRQSMPHLSELARKYKGKVEFMSVAVWETAHTSNKNAPYAGEVTDFVKHAGEMMDYPVAMDGPDGYMANTWLKASGTMGIPAAFIIDTNGKLAWFDPPFENMEEAIDLALDGKLDSDAVAKVKADYKAGMEQRSKLSKEAKDAIRAGNAQQALDYANQASEAMPVFADDLWSTIYQAHALNGKEEARAYVDEILKAHSDAPIALYMLSETVQKDDPETAVRVLQGAMRCSRPNDPFLAMSLAKAYAAVGDYGHAVQVQERAVAGLNDPTIDDYKTMIDPQTKVLEGYREKMNQSKGQR